MIATQLFAKAKTDIPELEAKIAAGQFKELRQWLAPRYNPTSSSTICRPSTRICMASELWHMHACVFVCDFSDASTHLVHSHLPTAREPHIHSPAHTRPQACGRKLHKCSLHSILN